LEQELKKSLKISEADKHTDPRIEKYKKKIPIQDNSFTATLFKNRLMII
jgi:hypothetical protein